MRWQYKAGDSCWIRLHGRQGLHQGVVHTSFLLPTVTHPIYLIQLVDPSWPTIEARDPWLMGETERDMVPEFMYSQSIVPDGTSISKN